MSRGPAPKHPIKLTRAEYEKLAHIARLRQAPYFEVVRAKILLAAFEHPGWSNVAIARTVGCTDWTVRKWRRRSEQAPVIQDMSRPGAPRFFQPASVPQ
jgi:hypothetical protein